MSKCKICLLSEHLCECETSSHSLDRMRDLEDELARLTRENGELRKQLEAVTRHGFVVPAQSKIVTGSNLNRIIVTPTPGGPNA
jgi:hypothetical protein